MATTDADHHLHQQHQVADEAPPPPCTTTSITTPAVAADLGIDKISQQQDDDEEEEATKEVPAGDAAENEPPAVVSLRDEVAAVEPVPASVEAETVPTSHDATAAPASSLEVVEPSPVEEKKPALDDGAEPEPVSAPTESDYKLDAVVVEGQVKEEAAVEVEPLEKTESEGEVKDSLPEPEELTQDIESNAKEVVAREEREIDPVLSAEPTDEPEAKLKILPVADSEPEKKEEPEEVAEPENVVPGPVDEVTDGPQEDYSESAVVAEAVPSKDVAEDDEVVDQTAPAQESSVPTTNEKDADEDEASTETVVPAAEKAVAVEINTAAEGLPEGEAEKMEEGVEETIAEPEELISGGTENGTNEVEEKLNVESVQEEEVKQVAGEDVKAEEVTEENIEKLEEIVSSGAENGTNVVEEKFKEESVLEEEAEVAKAEEVTEVKTENPEELVSNGTENGTNVVEKDESLLEKEAKDAKAEEVTEVKSENPEELVSNGTDNGTSVVEKELKDESLVEDVKAEEVAQNVSVNAGDAILDKDVAGEQNLGAAKETEVEKRNESESAEEEAAKPNDSSALEPPKADDTGDLPVTEVITKSTPKSSGNIMSKVKQSLVKVKKAITGKSPASKTAS